MRRARWWWAGYGACAFAVLVALGFLSRTALELEAQTQEAACHARFQDRLRLALWRMDSLVLPLVAREGARPYFEYLPYFPQERAYNRFLTALTKGEVLTPSPLLNAAPEFIHLHFQVDRAGTFTSPQVPSGNLRDLAEATCLPVGEVSARDSCLLSVRATIPLAEVRARVLAAEKDEEALAGRLLAPHPLPSAQVRAAGDPSESAARQSRTYKSKRDAQNAADVAANAPHGNDEPSGDGAASLAPVETAPPSVHVGTLVPLWLGDPVPELFLFRRVCVGDDELLQGVWLDWPALKGALLAEVAELLPGAGLDPLRCAATDWATREPSALATVPVRLTATAPAAASEGGAAWRPVHGTLALTWGAVAAALLAGAVVLRAILVLGERRQRFASAVTHELRTPLTTFRMYSEMLAEGMVKDEGQRGLYLRTLKDESGRLATMVENVLAYARLEEGSGRARLESIALGELLERHRAQLDRRAHDGGFELAVAPLSGEARLRTDVDAVGQVLFNLVDNACKYAHGAQPARLELTARAVAGSVAIRLRDFGPGIAPELARRVFAPFDRGARDGDPAPGVGLGLALARGIARDLGGDLALVDAGGPGAAFELTLPAQR
jgi:signal transduction histidine kinase